MKKDSTAWSRMGLQFRLQVLIQGVLVVLLLVAQHWIMLQFEHQVVGAAEERAKMVADGTINGLNTLMITKLDKDTEVISDKKSRLQFIQKMGKSEGIKELRVFRAKQLDSEFPEGLPEEQPVDDTDRRILAGEKPAATIIHGRDGEAWLRTEVPFVAKKDFRSIKCLECHGVDEGFVLGGASVVIDIRGDLATVSRLNTWLWVAQGGLQVVLFFVIGAIVRRLLAQLGGEPTYVIDIVRQIAKGDLAGDIATRPGDTGSLLAATKQMQAGLRHIVGDILGSAEDLSHAARQLTDSSAQVLAASERQSDSSTTVAASVEQMTACIEQIADNAANAQKHAADTDNLATEGVGVVEEVIGEMDLISEAVTSSSAGITSLGEQSKQISQIVNVIKEIADQTNLLALNAAIEAARAGEQGRGFAVVADEVRKLAERTTLSTQEIAPMIQGIQNSTKEAVEGMARGSSRVVEGVQMVSRAGTSIQKMHESVAEVLVAVGEISAALKEQSAASNLVAGNLQGIAQMTEETSAVIREVADAAHHLDHLASQLKDSAAQFRL